jgi:hypothetical protein
MNKESQVIAGLDYESIGEEISMDLASKMVKDHSDANANQSFSYVIGKTIIEKILAQPGCVGIRFVDAINEEGTKTLVYVGLDSKGKTLLEISSVNEHGKLAVTPAMLGDKTITTFNWFS